MAHWLITYRRSAQQLEGCEEITGGMEDLRTALDRQIRNTDPDLEVVLLTARSLEDLKITHGRYFYSVPELLDRMCEQLRRLEERLDNL